MSIQYDRQMNDIKLVMNSTYPPCGFLNPVVLQVLRGRQL